MSWRDINAMLRCARKILRNYPDAIVLIDIRVFNDVGPQPEHWTMVVDEEHGDDRLRIGITNRKP
jgi:hypothetical protein